MTVEKRAEVLVIDPDQFEVVRCRFGETLRDQSLDGVVRHSLLVIDRLGNGEHDHRTDVVIFDLRLHVRAKRCGVSRKKSIVEQSRVDGQNQPERDEQTDQREQTEETQEESLEDFVHLRQTSESPSCRVFRRATTVVAGQR